MLLYHLVHLLSPSCISAAFTVLSASIMICMYILADLTFFCSFSFLLIYFSSLVCALTDLGSTCCQCCMNINVQCKLILLPLYGQLNCVLAALDAVACSAGNLMTLVGLGRLFMGAVCCHCHCLCCSVTSAPATTVANPFSSPAEFSCLVSAFKGILDVLCYQVCWSFLVEVR